MDVSSISGAGMAAAPQNVSSAFTTSTMEKVMDVVETTAETLLEGLEALMTGLGRQIDVSA